MGMSMNRDSIIISQPDTRSSMGRFMRLRFFLWYIRAMSVEKTLYFVDGALQEKHQHAVAGLHVGVAAD